MLIQFRCTNIAEFDPESGDYHNCDQPLQAESEYVGKRVRCPKCNQTVVVPTPAMATNTVGGGFSQGTAQDSMLGIPSEDQTMNRLDYSRFDRRTRCPKCGSALDENQRCTTCYYVRPTVQPNMAPLEKIEVKPAGFQLWFMQILADGISPKLVEVASHCLFGMFIVMCALATIGLGGGENLVIALIALFAFVSIYLLIVNTTKQLATKPAMAVPFWLKPFWNLVLILARSLEWTKYDPKLAKRVVVDKRKTNFGDRELLELEELNTCQVLDLQGTSITDNALSAMYGLKHLRCLVLKNTNVTREGVFRLQQAIPKCWIWY